MIYCSECGEDLKLNTKEEEHAKKEKIDKIIICNKCTDVLLNKRPIGYCKECGDEIYHRDNIDNHKNIYECSNCNHPNHTNELYPYKPLFPEINNEGISTVINIKKEDK